MTAGSNLKAAAAHAVRALPPISDVLAAVGAGLVAEGFREYSQPLGLIVAGMMILMGVFSHARGVAPTIRDEGE